MLLLLFLTLSFTLTFQQQVSNSDEEDALLELFEDNGGVIWRRQFDLGSLCSSTSITCNSDDRVTELDLRSNNLQGKLSRSIGDLTKLEVLDLSDNMLIDEIPDELFEISTLRTLYLAGNYFSCPIPDYRSITTNDFSQTDHCDNYPCENVDNPCDCTEYHCGGDWGWSKSDGCVEGASTSEDELINGGCNNCRNQELCDCTPESCDVGWGWTGDRDDGHCEFDKRTNVEELVEAECYDSEGECSNANNACACLEDRCGDDWGWDSTVSACVFGAQTTHAELEAAGCSGCFGVSICDCTDENCPPNWGWAGDVRTGQCEYDKTTTDVELYEASCTDTPPETETPSTPSTPETGECSGVVDVCDCTEAKCDGNWGWSSDTSACLKGAGTTQKELLDGGCRNCVNKRSPCECTTVSNTLVPGDCEEGWGWSGDLETGSCTWGASTSDLELAEDGCIADPAVCLDCATPHLTSGCEHQATEECVCDIDPFCCQSNWDSVCIVIAFQGCGCSSDARTQHKCGRPGLEVCECTEDNCGDNWGWNSNTDACEYNGVTKTSELVQGECTHCANSRDACECDSCSQNTPGWGWDESQNRCEYGKTTSEDELVLAGCAVPEECTSQESGRWESAGGASLLRTSADSAEECCVRCLNFDNCLWSYKTDARQCILNSGGSAEVNDDVRGWVHGPAVVN